MAKPSDVCEGTDDILGRELFLWSGEGGSDEALIAGEGGTSALYWLPLGCRWAEIPLRMLGPLIELWGLSSMRD